MSYLCDKFYLRTLCALLIITQSYFTLWASSSCCPSDRTGCWSPVCILGCQTHTHLLSKFEGSVFALMFPSSWITRSYFYDVGGLHTALRGVLWERRTRVSHAALLLQRTEGTEKVLDLSRQVTHSLAAACLRLPAAGVLFLLDTFLDLL